MVFGWIYVGLFCILLILVVSFGLWCACKAKTGIKAYFSSIFFAGLMFSRIFITTIATINLESNFDNVYNLELSISSGANAMLLVITYIFFLCTKKTIKENIKFQLEYIVMMATLLIPIVMGQTVQVVPMPEGIDEMEECYL